MSRCNHIWKFSLLAGIALGALSLVGCGSTDLNSSSRNGSFDQGLQGNYNGFNNPGSRNANGLNPRSRGTYAKIETSFELPEVKGNPFDIAENDVQVTIQAPDGRSVRVPAFFDGAKLWKVRFTPDTTGRYTIGRIQNNGKDATPERVERKDFDASGSIQAGFIRHDTKDKQRFVFDSGANYYPLGHNVATNEPKTDDSAARPAPDAKPALADQKSPQKQDTPVAKGTSNTNYAADYLTIFEKMSKAGENWTNVWSSPVDGKSLFWNEKNKTPVGQIDLEAARRLDSLITSAESQNIYLQLTLFQDNQFSTKNDTRWDKNPWNKKNGGFLNTPDEFFSNSRAIGLTKSLVRYFVARWGYSSNIMSWQLFNDVTLTDAYAHKHSDEIAAWHDTFATFIRAQDANKHLITSGIGTDPLVLGRELDYYQLHRYSADALYASADVDVRKLDRPAFVGEIGYDNDEISKSDFLHTALWCGLMSEAGGGAQFWDSQVIDKSDLYAKFRSPADFLRQSGMLSSKGLLTGPISVDSGALGNLVLNPGSNAFGNSLSREISILPSGTANGMGDLSKYLPSGSSRANANAGYQFKTDWSKPGTIKFTADKTGPAGANIALAVDGVTVTEKVLSGNLNARTTIEGKVPQGSHTIKITNAGADWARIRDITLEGYSPSIGAFGKSNKNSGVAYLFRRDGQKTGSVSAKVNLPVTQTGTYKVTWWDTVAGKALSESIADSGSFGISVETPKFETDLACYYSQYSEKGQKSTKSKSAKTK